MEVLPPGPELNHSPYLLLMLPPPSYSLPSLFVFLCVLGGGGGLRRSMSTTVNEGAWDWTRLKDDSPVVKSNAWSHLLQTSWMALMVPLQHRTEVVMVGVAGWGPKGGGGARGLHIWLGGITRPWVSPSSHYTGVTGVPTAPSGE